MLYEVITSSGTNTFLGLSDTPSAYTGSSNKLVKVGSGETGLDYSQITASSGSLSNVVNIALTGTVDGRDVSLDGSNLDTHLANDNDLSATNEIQDLSLDGDTIYLSGSSSTVDLSTSTSIRITSYNVCYTKLLRFHLVLEPGIYPDDFRNSLDLVFQLLALKAVESTKIL